MKRALFCFMVISLFLCLGGYGQAAQVMDRVSFTVTDIETDMIDEGFIYNEEELDSLIGQTLDLFIVVYDNESVESSVWDNNTGDLDIYLTEEYGGVADGEVIISMSDGSYLLGRGLLKLLDVFNFVQPSYPSVRQVYGQANGTTTYNYVFRLGYSGFLFDFNPDLPPLDLYHSVIIYDDQERTASVRLRGDPIVKRVIINIPTLPGKAKAPRILPIGGIR